MTDAGVSPSYVSQGFNLQAAETPAKLNSKNVHWKSVQFLTKVAGRLENQAQKVVEIKEARVIS